VVDVSIDVDRLEPSRSASGSRATLRAAEQHPISFGLLGPLEIRINGRALELRRAKERTLLAALLLRAGEIVSRDQLIDALWGENPPKAAIGSLQNFVSALRKALGAELLHTRSGGYSLEVQRESVDIHRFVLVVSHAHAAGGHDARADLLRSALALWRGNPFADFRNEPFAQVAIARLEQLRLAAREELIDLELDLGYHHRVADELETLVASHPFREHLRAQLMLALYRSGRQAEALAVYRSGRRALHDELGLEPGEELRELQQAILAHDPRLRSGIVGTTRSRSRPSEIHRSVRTFDRVGDYVWRDLTGLREI
jgi:DNA-binding SARP family transcriptional activator